MKKIVMEFCRRGLLSCGIGPIVLATLYLILKSQNIIDTLTINEVCIGIFSLTALAFIAGGLNVVYQIEQLPLMIAILIHGAVLYICYLLTYLANSWLEWGIIPFLVFSGIFVFGYLIIWIVIYSIIKKNSDTVNEILKKRQERELSDNYF